MNQMSNPGATLDQEYAINLEQRNTESRENILRGGLIFVVVLIVLMIIFVFLRKICKSNH